MPRTHPPVCGRGVSPYCSSKPAIPSSTTLSHSEKVVGRAVKGRRDEVKIATKFGLVQHRGDHHTLGTDSTPANVRAAVEGSRRRLDTDYIDLVYQHRVDPNTPIEETAGAVADLIAQGKDRHFGQTEEAPAKIPRAHDVQPHSELQTEYSQWTRDAEDEILPLLRELGIGFVPYSPLGHGLLTGQIRTVDDFGDDDWRKTTRVSLPAQPGDRRRGRGHRRHSRSDGAGLVTHPSRRHRSNPGHPSCRTRRGEHGSRPEAVPVRRLEEIARAELASNEAGEWEYPAPSSENPFNEPEQHLNLRPKRPAAQQREAESPHPRQHRYA